MSTPARPTKAQPFDAATRKSRLPGRVKSYGRRFAITFFVCNFLLWISIHLPSANPNLKDIWLPAGVALVAVWRWGYGMLPAVALAEFVPPFSLFIFTGALSGTCGAVFEMALAVWLLRRLDVHPELDRLSDLLLFAAIAVMVSPAAGGALASLLLQITGLVSPGHFWVNTLNWWVGDAAGIVMLSPLLLLWSTSRYRVELLRRWREFAALLTCWGLVSLWIAHFSRFPAWERNPMTTLLDPLLLWAALRFGPAGVVVLCPLAMLQGWALQPGGFHPLPGNSLTAQVPYPLINILVVWGTALVLATVMWEVRGAESNLQRSTRALSELINALPLAVLAVDAENRVHEWNHAAESLFGGNRQERIGQPWPFASQDELARRLQASLQTARLHGLEVSWHDPRHPDLRRLRLYSASIGLQSAPAKAPSSSPASTMILIADVTAQHALQERMKQAERLKKIGQLTGGITQDLDRLLGRIRTEAEAVIGETTDPTARSRAEEVRVTAGRAFTLIRQLLAFSQRQPLAPGSMDLNQAIRMRLPFLRHLAGPSVNLEERLAPHLPRVALRESQLEQILLNLVVNARDAMPEGGQLEIATLDLPKPGNEVMKQPCVRLTVADTGCGMSPEIQARIFEPFFTTKAVGHGSGLGLATVYGVIQQAGGSIQMWSQPNAGTRFEILLPCAPADTAASRS